MKFTYETFCQFVRKSSNMKTGEMPVTTSPRITCPDNCPMKGLSKAIMIDGKEKTPCYGESAHCRGHWNTVDNATEAHLSIMSFRAMCKEIAALPIDSPWRMNEKGDLPGVNDKISAPHLDAVVKANKGKQGWTYTHKLMTGNSKTAKDNRKAVKAANKGGFTINLSADNPLDVDKLRALNIAPVVCILPLDAADGVKYSTMAGEPIQTCPAGLKRNKDNKKVCCKNCNLCRNPERKYPIGLPAHGPWAKKMDKQLKAALLT